MCVCACVCVCVCVRVCVRACACVATSAMLHSTQKKRQQQNRRKDPQSAGMHRRSQPLSDGYKCYHEPSCHVTGSFQTVTNAIMNLPAT